MATDFKQFTKLLQHDNEVVANDFMNMIRQNLSQFDVGSDKAKFLESKKKEVMALLRKYDEAAMKILNNEIFKINSKHMRSLAEREAAEENRSFASKVKNNFERDDSHNAIRSKNLGISEA